MSDNCQILETGVYAMKYYFEGFLRDNNTAGTRNYIGIVCSVICSNTVAKEIAEQIPEAVPILHSNGCAQLGDDFHLTKNMLIGVTSNPNIRAALIVGLGCETNQVKGMLESISLNKPVKGIEIQQLAGRRNTISHGLKLAGEWTVNKEKRQRLSISYLNIGIVITDIDDDSLTKAAPVIGKVIDLLIENRATVIMGVNEDFEAGHALSNYTCNEGAEVKLQNLHYRFKRKRWQDPYQQYKSENHMPYEEEEDINSPKPSVLLNYAEAPETSGLYLAKASQNLTETLSNLASCGCNVSIVLSSRGILSGSVAMPCMTITVKQTDSLFEELVDYTITEDTASAEAEKIVTELIRISSGKETSLEQHQLGEFSIPHIGTTF